MWNKHLTLAVYAPGMAKTMPVGNSKFLLLSSSSMFRLTVRICPRFQPMRYQES